MKITFNAHSFAELAVLLEIALDELRAGKSYTTTPADDNVKVVIPPAAPTVTPPPAPNAITPPPVAPATPSSDYVQGSGEGVDKDGLPWDERIHSSNKKRTAKNIWERRRNVSDDVYSAVVAELRGGAAPAAPTVTPPAPAITPSPAPQPAPAVPAAPAAPHAANTPVAPVAPTDLSQIPPHIANAAPQVPLNPPAPPAPPVTIPPVAQAAPAAPVVPAPAPVAPTKTVNDLLLKIQGIFQANPSDMAGNTAYVTSLQQRIGSAFGLTVNSVMDIQARPDAIEWALATIAADGK